MQALALDVRRVSALASTGSQPDKEDAATPDVASFMASRRFRPADMAWEIMSDIV
jgi:hypothetical protein